MPPDLPKPTLLNLPPEIRTHIWRELEPDCRNGLSIKLSDGTIHEILLLISRRNPDESYVQREAQDDSAFESSHWLCPTTSAETCRCQTPGNPLRFANRLLQKEHQAFRKGDLGCMWKYGRPGDQTLKNLARLALSLATSIAASQQREPTLQVQAVKWRIGSMETWSIGFHALLPGWRLVKSKQRFSGAGLEHGDVMQHVRNGRSVLGIWFSRARRITACVRRVDGTDAEDVDIVEIRQGFNLDPEHARELLADATITLVDVKEMTEPVPKIRLLINLGLY